MNRKTFFIILAVLCIIGAAVFVVVGIRATSQSAVIDGLTSLGELTFEAFDARQETDENNMKQYVVLYRHIDPKYGEIVLENIVDKDDYDSYKYDELRAEQANLTEVPEETNEITKRTTIKRYVYIYPKDGHYEAVFQDKYMALADVSELIAPATPVSSTYYYVFAALLLLVGAYLFFLAFAGKRTPEHR
jgi:hypothetical protein